MAEEFETYSPLDADERAKIEAQVTKKVTDKLTKEFNAKLNEAREEERAQTTAKIKRDYNRTNLRWSWFGGISGSTVVLASIVWAILSIAGCVQTNTAASAEKDQTATQWVHDCIVTQGGQVYQEAANFNKYATGPRLCVVGGEITDTMDYAK